MATRSSHRRSTARSNAMGGKHILHIPFPPRSKFSIFLVASLYALAWPRCGRSVHSPYTQNQLFFFFFKSNDEKIINRKKTRASSNSSSEQHSPCSSSDRCDAALTFSYFHPPCTRTPITVVVYLSYPRSGPLSKAPRRNA